MMKLVTAIVSHEDADKLMNALVKAGFPVTRMGSTGGFLRRGNATLIAGVDDEAIEEVLAMIRRMCRARTETILPPPIMAPTPGYIPTPVEVRVGGAVIFVTNVEHFEKT